MKISPVAAGGVPTLNPNEGRSVNQERLERAKAISAGQVPPEPSASGDPQVDRATQSLRKIRMNTQASTNRHEKLQAIVDAAAPAVDPAQATPSADPAVPATPPAATDILDPNEQAAGVSDDTKPLSPQFAALARQKRALQLKEKEIADREAALKAVNPNAGYTKEQIKENALSVLREAGVSNEDLTQALLNESDSLPAVSRLEAKIRAMEESIQKTLADRDLSSEQQVMAQMKREADVLVAEGDDYAFIREADMAQDVVDGIRDHFKETGELQDMVDVMNRLEERLIQNALKAAQLKKVQARLNASATPPQTQALPQDGQRKTMRTLTNRDGASPTMGRRERAIAAMEGRLNK